MAVNNARLIFRASKPQGIWTHQELFSRALLNVSQLLALALLEGFEHLDISGSNPGFSTLFHNPYHSQTSKLGPVVMLKMMVLMLALSCRLQLVPNLIPRLSSVFLLSGAFKPCLLFLCMGCCY